MFLNINLKGFTFKKIQLKIGLNLTHEKPYLDQTL